MRNKVEVVLCFLDDLEEVVMGEGMVVSSSSLVRSTKSCLGGMIVSWFS